MFVISNHIFHKFTFLGLMFIAFAGAGLAQCDEDAAGPNPAAIQGAVDAFRAHLGPNNGIGGSFISGRREINWDTVPESLTEPHSLTPDFFNFNSRRGAIFTTTAPPDPND